MKDHDIIEKIHGLYDVKEPDVLSNLSFSDVEMVPPPEKKPARRYICAAAIYAAVCLVAIAIIPLLVGKDSPEPIDPGNDPVPPVSESRGYTSESAVSEKITDDTEVLTSVSEPELPESIVDTTEEPYIPETYTTPAETTTKKPTSSTKETEPPRPKPLAKNYSTYDARRITAKKSGAQIVTGFSCEEYLDGLCPMYNITFWEPFWEETTDGRQYYRNRYNYTMNANTGKITSEKCTERDNSEINGDVETYYPQNSIPYGYDYFWQDMYNVCNVAGTSLMKFESGADIQRFIDTINKEIKYEEHFNSKVLEFVTYFDTHYDDEFFADNVLYVNFAIMGSTSILYSFEGVDLDENGVVTLSFNKHYPWVQTGLMSGEIYMFSFDRDDLVNVKDVKIDITVTKGKNPWAPDPEVTEESTSETTLAE